MIEWYKCTEKIPEKESKLIVKCGEKLFFGISTSWEFRYTNEDEFLFKMTYFAQSIPERETF